MADFVKSLGRVATLPWRTVAFVLGMAFVAATGLSIAVGQIFFAGVAKSPSLGAGRADGDSYNPPSPSASLNQAAVDLILKRNLFNSEGAAVDESKVEQKEEKPAAEAEAVKSDLPVKLLGTIYGGDPFSGIAMVENTQKKTINSFLVGDLLTKEATVLEIHKERVIVDRSGRREYIEVDKPTLARTRRTKKSSSPAATVAAIAPIATEPPPSRFVEEGFERDKTNIVMDQSYRNKMLTGDFTKILQDAKASPNMVEGQLRGFTLTRIRKDSIYEKAGLQNDDIVEEINGVPLTDTAQAIKLLQSLKSETEIEVRISRGGSPLKFMISIK